MTKREVVKTVLDGNKPPYVPWDCDFTREPLAILSEHLGTTDVDAALDNHFVKLGHVIGFVEPLGDERYKDTFGVIWDRTIEKDIGIIEGVVLEEPTLEGYEFPDPLDDTYFRDIPEKLEKYGDCFRVYCIGFSLYERAWALRGLENTLMDFHLNPGFMHDLLDRICEYNIARVKKALEYDIDAVYFGDDWGKQHGLIMGPKLWNEFIRPRVERMYAVVREGGKYQFIHSCGDIHELIDDLIGLGVNCINPVQPEAMDVTECLTKYRGRVTFHGGLSTQRTLAHGAPEDVRNEARSLLELGADGSYIFSPSHAAEKNTTLENMLAFIEEVHAQEAYRELVNNELTVQSDRA